MIERQITNICEILYKGIVDFTDLHFRGYELETGTAKFSKTAPEKGKGYVTFHEELPVTLRVTLEDILKVVDDLTFQAGIH